MKTFFWGAACAALLRVQRKAIPGYQNSKYGGETFNDSPVAHNLWQPSNPYPLLGALKPVAPFDRVDSGPIPSLSAVPIQPGGDPGIAPEAQMYSDVVPPQLHPYTFPYEKMSTCVDSRAKKLDERHLVPKPDRLRPHSAYNDDPEDNYPNQAPGSRMSPPQPTAAQDRIPHEYARYFEQIYNNEEKRQRAQKTYKKYKAADMSNDDSIDWDEFKQEVEGRQLKSPEDTLRLWNAYKQADSEVMGAREYQKVVRDGFDVGTVSRSVRATIEVSCGLSIGFWAGAVTCPNNTIAVGARLKVQPLADNSDNTAVNAIEFRCLNITDNSEQKDIATVEGPLGDFSEWGVCPEGLFLVGFRSRMQFFQPQGDNTGLSDVAFLCQDKTGVKRVELRFGDDKLKTEEAKAIEAGKVIVAAGNRVDFGGWANNLYCPPKTALCGLQPRVEIGGAGHGDAIGITNERFFCCDDPNLA